MLPLHLPAKVHETISMVVVGAVLCQCNQGERMRLGQLGSCCYLLIGGVMFVLDIVGGIYQRGRGLALM